MRSHHLHLHGTLPLQAANLQLLLSQFAARTSTLLACPHAPEQTVVLRTHFLGPMFVCAFVGMCVCGVRSCARAHEKLRVLCRVYACVRVWCAFVCAHACGYVGSGVAMSQ